MTVRNFVQIISFPSCLTPFLLCVVSSKIDTCFLHLIAAVAMSGQDQYITVGNRIHVVFGLDKVSRSLNHTVAVPEQGNWH
jgi:hypothetical protein